MSPAPSRLLVVDDEPDLLTLYELTLVREGYQVDTAATVEEAWALLAAQPYHAVISDMRLPDGSGLDLLRRIERDGRSERLIVITAYGSAESAVEALKLGAYDYLTKPVDLRQFRAVVASATGRAAAPEPGPAAAAVPRSRARQPGGAAAEASASFLQRLAGDSSAMQEVRALVRKVARSMAPVLIQGESGTGKELVARAIHQVSPRGGGAFVAVNCGAIPENLLEAEFFGYRKGAFTGAAEDRDGFFQAAQGGTLFLDEIGDLPLAMQSKLLRAIQERAVRPVGATAELPVDVRIVSATHHDLAGAVQAVRFRQDLFYRLNVIPILMPPLRERSGDLADICAAVLARIAHDAGVVPVPRLSPEALQRLQSHAFPGNVRELENLLHRALALSGAELIGPADLGLVEAAAADAGALAAVPAAALPVALPVPVPEAAAAAPALPSSLELYLDAVERDILVRALEQHRHNRTAAGASLGLSLRQMRYRMARLGVQGKDGPGDRGDGG